MIRRAEVPRNGQTAGLEEGGDLRRGEGGLPSQTAPPRGISRIAGDGPGQVGEDDLRVVEQLRDSYCSSARIKPTPSAVRPTPLIAMGPSLGAVAGGS
jgi:hypothetical protein